MNLKPALMRLFGWLLVAFIYPCPAAHCQTNNFSRDVLVDAFEKGRSLLAVKVLAVAPLKAPQLKGTFFVYKVETVQPIVLGDLEQGEIKSPLTLFAGAAYGNALKVGSSYALFVIKEEPHSYSWAHRSTVVEIDVNNSTQLKKLSQEAQKIYETVPISQFRRTQFSGRPKLPKLPQELLRACQQFRKSRDRAQYVAIVASSPLASRRDDFTPKSTIVYLPPAIKLTRRQLLFLLGAPDLKSGRDYVWYCGEDGQKYPHLHASFDEKDSVKHLF